MKTIIKNIVLFSGMIFILSGCYTIVWDPAQEFPDEDSYNESIEFYGSEYYGGYGSYYESPWWVTVPVYLITPDGGTADRNNTKERGSGRTSDTQDMRNSGGRGNTDRESGIRTTNPTTTETGGNSTVIKTPPPTRDSGSDRNTGSVDSPGNNNSSSNNNRSTGSSSTRNESGSRNSGSGRR